GRGFEAQQVGEGQGEKSGGRGDLEEIAAVEAFTVGPSACGHGGAPDDQKSANPEWNADERGLGGWARIRQIRVKTETRSFSLSRCLIRANPLDPCSSAFHS